MSTLLNKTRQINELLQQKNTFDSATDLPYDQMAMVLGEILNSNTYIISQAGALLGFTEKHDVNNARVKNMFIEKQFPKSYTDMVDRLSMTEANIPISSDLTAFPVESRELYPDGVTTIVPIYGAGARIGTIILSRIDRFFDDD